MCRFASFVLTKDREFYIEDEDSHSEIISKNKLHEWGVNGPNIVKVEIVPTTEIKTWPSLKKWEFVIDQDVLPDWADRKELETRTRQALEKRYKKGFKIVDVHGCTALTTLKADAAKTVDVHGCTALTTLKADAATHVYASRCTALTTLKADAATHVYADGCTALTTLKADAAQYVYANGCTALTTLKADAAHTVYASGCTALTTLKADVAHTVYASGCTALKYKAKKGQTVYS